MNAILLMLISIVVLFIGYVTYGSYLAKQWGIDVKRKTPAQEINDGVDYVPTKAPVLLGHHFSSIAGAGPINGPIQAAVFGWLPVTLWILIGGIFFGAVQDFSSLFASIRHGGKSIGTIIEANMGKRGKKLFLVFAWLTLMLVVAAFASIVADTFNGFTADGAPNSANGSTATTSVLFIAIAILFGMLVYRRGTKMWIATIIGVVLIGVCIAIGLVLPVYFSKDFWLVILLAYIFIASVAPVWILLQPRDYLSSFLLYGMMILAVFGIIAYNPQLALPAVTSFTPAANMPLFPMLFITVACGAISGFHSLVGSGTSSKQIQNEKDAKLIGYGGMLIECGLAVVAVISAAFLFQNADLIAIKDNGQAAGAPAVVFATGVSVFTTKLGLPQNVIYTIVTLAISTFALTSLDTATRLGRYMFQEFFVAEGEDVSKLTGYKKVLANKYVSTLISVAIGGALAFGGWSSIWPLFGSANQLLAALALLAVALWMSNIGKKKSIFLIPMAFMLAATLSALIIGLVGNINTISAIAAGTAAEGTTYFTPCIQLVFGVLLFVLAIFLTIEGVRTISARSKKQAAQNA